MELSWETRVADFSVEYLGRFRAMRAKRMQVAGIICQFACAGLVARRYRFIEGASVGRSEGLIGRNAQADLCKVVW